MTQQTVRSPKEIAAGLSEAQRRDLLRLHKGEHNPGWAIFLLIGKGLADYRKRWLLFGERTVTLTRKGLAVRAALSQPEPEQEGGDE